MEWEPVSHASTFGGNPVACAAALETLKLLKDGLIRNAGKMGEYLREHLWRLHRKFPAIGDVRGVGLMTGIEMVKDRETKEPDAELRDRVVEKAFYRGLLLLGCGESGIRFSPALTVKKEEVDVAMEILEECFQS